MSNTEFQAKCVCPEGNEKLTIQFSQILAKESEYFSIVFVQSKINTSTVRGDDNLTSEHVTSRNERHHVNSASSC